MTHRGYPFPFILVNLKVASTTLFLFNCMGSFLLNLVCVRKLRMLHLSEKCLDECYQVLRLCRMSMCHIVHVISMYYVLGWASPTTHAFNKKGGVLYVESRSVLRSEEIGLEDKKEN